MKSIIKIVSLGIALFLSTSVYADIQVKSYISQFIDGYKQLKTHSFNANRRYIMHYETVTQPTVSRIFFGGHPIPDHPRIYISLRKYAANLPAIIQTYEVKTPEIKEIAKEVQERTQRLFGKEIYAKVYITTSVSDTDAVTVGNADGKPPIVALNMRVVSRYSKDDLRILLSHELFHVLQHQIETDHSKTDPIAEFLYSEGLATYASSLIYPGFADWKYISFYEKNDNQFNRFEASRSAITRSIFRDWNSRQKNKFIKYFSADPDASRPFEPRSGYYLGYMVAKEMAQKTSPVKVALIKYTDFKKQFKQIAHNHVQ